MIMMACCVNAQQQFNYNDVIYLKNGGSQLCKVIFQSQDSVWVMYPTGTQVFSLSMNQIAHINMSSQSILPQSNQSFEETRPSYYLQKSGDQFIAGIAISAVGGFLGGVMQSVGVSFDEAEITTIGSIIIYGTSIAGFIFECCAVSNLRKAGRAMERITINSNGVQIAL